MNIFIVTLGSRGDVQPYVALGKGLKTAGHTVTLCTSSSFEPIISEHGLTYGYMNNGLMDLMESDEARDAMENMTNPWEWIKAARSLWKRAGPLQQALLNDSWQSAQEANPDLIIFHPKTFGGVHFGEKLGVPVILALPFPMLVPTAEFPGLGFPTWKLGGWYNRLTYRLTLKATALATRKYIKEWRKANNMSPRKMDLLHNSVGDHIPVLHSFSKHVVPEPGDWPANATATGYWFLGRLGAWQPPDRLQEFLNAGEPPVYVGFGSMAGRHPQRVTRVVIEALQQAKVRGMIASGWGGLEASDLPDSILKIDEAPHDWLFPRMAAVVHHGGAGTTAAGIRAARPTVICPFFGDQPFWGRRIRELGVGSEPIQQKKLTVDNLAAAIREATIDQTIQQNAEALGKEIRGEDGVGKAVAVIEKTLMNA